MNMCDEEKPYVIMTWQAPRKEERSPCCSTNTHFYEAEEEEEGTGKNVQSYAKAEEAIIFGVKKHFLSIL